jgi:hypothetical protein
VAILQTIHGELRWILALFAIIAIVKFAVGWLNNARYQSLDQRLMSVFTIAMDLNLTLGLILLVWLGIVQGVWPAARLEHAVTMIIAVAIAHSSAAWRKSPDDTKKFRNNLAVVLASLVFVFVGVLRLRGGWMF